jgi:hypothetical protein
MKKHLKVWIKIFGVLLLVGLVAGGIIWRRQTVKPKFTGALDEPVSEAEENEARQVYDLKQLLPMEGVGFRIEYDNRELKFEVYLVEPYSDNRAGFFKWLDEMGFELIPRDKFKYLLD